MDSPASCRISVPGSTQGSSRSLFAFAYGALTLSGWLSHTIPLTLSFVTPCSWPYNPRTARCSGLGFSHFARHYFGNHFLSSGYLDVSVPQVPLAYLFVSIYDTGGSLQWVSPFGHPRIGACSQLPEAFRSVPRPSSAFGAKASTVNP